MAAVRQQVEHERLVRLGMAVPERQPPRPKQRVVPAKVEKFVDRTLSS
jgi:hypothetical protein